jgi:hypothetical protein
VHRERPLDFWLTIATVIALLVPIWGILLEPSMLIRVPVYLLVIGIPAGALVIGVLIYAEIQNRVLLNRFLTGYLAGFAGSLVVYICLLIGRVLGLAPDLVGTLGKMMLGVPLNHSATTGILAAGFIYHFLMNGSAWGAIYGLVFGKAPWWFGAFYGLGIAAILLVSPSFYRFGFQAAGSGKGAAILISIVVVHLAYGSTIGLIVRKYVFPEVGVEGAKAIKPTYA